VVARSSRHHREALAMNALEEVLLCCDEHNGASPANRDGRMDRRVREAIDRVCRDLAAPWEVAALARVAGMSPSRFAHRFTAEVGESPRRFVERQRIERGRHLLRTSDLGIAEIAAAVGYDDPFHFSTRFRALTGLAPRAYRAARTPRISHTPRPR
jgi:AraC family transcriptional regulator of arabinose operon